MSGKHDLFMNMVSSGRLAGKRNLCCLGAAAGVRGGRLVGRLTGRQCGDAAGGGTAPARRGAGWESEVGLGASVWWPTVGFVTGQVSENPTGPCL